MNKKITSAIIILSIIALIYLLIQVSIFYGTLKEKNSRVCVEPYEFKNWERSIDDVGNIFKDIMITFSDDLERANMETEKWRDRYFLLKRQNENTVEILK